MQFLSVAAFGLAALLALAFGARYVFTQEFMPYHATVLGKPWAALEPRLQFIILGMLKVAGGGLLGYGVALLWLLLPLHRGEAWAAWAALTVSLVVVVPILYVPRGPRASSSRRRRFDRSMVMAPCGDSATPTT